MAKFNEEAFLNDFAKLMADAMVVAKGESDAIATVAEALASHLGRFIAFSCKGDAKLTGKFLEGAIHYAETTAAETLPAAKFINDARNAIRSK
jgi:hypothetical protein